MGKEVFKEEDDEAPGLYSIDAIYTNETHIEDTPVFLCIEPNEGMLSIFQNYDEYLNNEDPLERVKLVDIYEIEPTRGTFGMKTSVAYFLIHDVEGSRKFYL